MRGSTVTPCPIGFLCELLCDLGDSAVPKRVFFTGLFASARCRLCPHTAFAGKLLSRDRRCRQSDRTGEHSSRARADFRGRARAKRTCLHPVCRKAPVSCVNLSLSPGTRCGTAWLRQQPGKETLLHPDGVERTAFAAAPAGQTLVVVEVRVVPHLNGVHRTD